MIISLDRENGLFNAQMADRINIKSEQLWNNIQALDVPTKAFKEKVSIWKINTTKNITSHCFSIGRTHIINFVLNDDISSNDDYTFIEFGDVPFTPVCDIIWMSDKAMWKIPANSIKLYIYPFSGGTKGDHVFMFFNA